MCVEFYEILPSLVCFRGIIIMCQYDVYSEACILYLYHGDCLQRKLSLFLLNWAMLACFKVSNGSVDGEYLRDMKCFARDPEVVGSNPRLYWTQGV